MTDPGLPLTTGEGNTAREWAREYDIDCVVCPVCAFTFDKCHVTDATGEYDCPVCECGRLRAERDEAVAQSEEDGLVMENAHRTALAAEADRDALREQLDAARTDLEAIAYIAENPAKQGNALAGIAGIARAALGVEGPAAGDGQP